MKRASGAGPLDGLRVVDCSRGTAGTRAGGWLADYGADVVWVEPPGGDPYRESLANAYACFNRGKRSVQLDLRDPHGHDAFLRLLRSADVFLHSWRPGVAERLGLGFEDLHPALPGLVYCSISGFGPADGQPSLPGYEALVQATVGTMGEQVGHRDGPIYEGVPFATVGAAFLAVIGTLAALYRRFDDGLGRHVETSLLDGALAYLSMNWADDDLDSPPHTPGGRRLLVRALECADGEYVGVHTGAVGAFDRLMQVLGLAEHFALEPGQLSMGVVLSPEQLRIMQEEVPRAFAGQPRDVWLKELRDADVCAIPELHPGQVFDEPQPRHNGMVIRVDDPVLGSVEQVAPAARFGLTPHDDPQGAPSPGQHDDALEALSQGAPWQDPTERRAGAAGTTPLLEGVRILDLGAYFAGPFASRLLADLGADVIKLEPLAGDQLRGLFRPFAAAQRGKRAVALDLKSPEARDAGLRLAAWADVVTHNMRPGAAERIGLGYEQVREVNRDVVYVYGPGWGSSGPDQMRQSFAPLLSGYVGANYEVAGAFNPPLFPVGNEDPGAGLVGAVATLMALLHRRRSGRGQYVETPQLNAAMTHLAHVVRLADGTVVGAGRLDTLQTGVSPLDRVYETADGWVCLVAHTDEEIAGSSERCRSRSAPARFATAAGRSEHDYELSQLVGSALAAISTEEAIATLTAADVPAVIPVPRNDVSFLRDPQNHRTGRVAESAHPVHGHVRELAHLVRITDSSWPPNRSAPDLGEHTDEVLQMVGCSEEDIGDMRLRGLAR